MKKQLREIVSNLTGFDPKLVDSVILSGKVLVNDVVCYKPGTKYHTDSDFRIKESNEYVSRGAYKLLKGIEYFNVNVTDKVCIDGGSSTGGFTQVLLKNGARIVYSVDCGTNQLDYSLRVDRRVISMEGLRVQDVDLSKLNDKPELAVADVSFTSCLPIISHFFYNLNIKEAIILLKPQFEYSRLKSLLNLNDNFDGIVTSVEDREQIRDYTLNEIKSLNILINGITESPIKGASGNVEYIVLLSRS